MSDSERPRIGSIGWTDLTVPEADPIRDFYGEVIGWKPEPLDMGGYSDYVMAAPDDGTPVAGICHARGTNAGLPAQWLNYVVVDDVERRASRAAELGGEIVVAPKAMGSQGRYCVIRDPAGAVVALFEPAR